MGGVGVGGGGVGGIDYGGGAVVVSAACNSVRAGVGRVGAVALLSLFSLVSSQIDFIFNILYLGLFFFPYAHAAATTFPSFPFIR